MRPDKVDLECWQAVLRDWFGAPVPAPARLYDLAGVHARLELVADGVLAEGQVSGLPQHGGGVAFLMTRATLRGLAKKIKA